MIGTRVESRSTFPVFGLILAISAMTFVVLSFVTGLSGFSIAAVLPGLMASVLFLAKEPWAAITITEDGIEHESARNSDSIRYDEIEKVWTPRRKLDPKEAGPPSYPIVIAHANGILVLPTKLDIQHDLLYRHLLASVPVGGSADVHGDLVDYLADQRREFGDDRVWSYRASERKPSRSYRKLRLMSLTALAAGAVWIVLGAMSEVNRGWAGGGILLCIFAGIFWLASFANQEFGTRFKGWKESSLVISPLGLALVQGDIRGELKWDELLHVTLSDSRTFRYSSHQQAGRGIFLKIDGATIFVPDIYDRPIFKIYKAIMKYWR
jgi:hypothetical protein